MSTPATWACDSSSLHLNFIANLITQAIQKTRRISPSRSWFELNWKVSFIVQVLTFFIIRWIKHFMNIFSLLKLIFQILHATEIHTKNPEVLVIMKGWAFKFSQRCKMFTRPPDNGNRRLASKPDVLLLQCFHSTCSLFWTVCTQNRMEQHNQPTKQRHLPLDRGWLLPDSPIKLYLRW